MARTDAPVRAKAFPTHSRLARRHHALVSNSLPLAVRNFSTRCNERGLSPETSLGG